MSWNDVKTRWPNREVDIKCLGDSECWYDFGHIPRYLFALKLHEYGLATVNLADIQECYWRLKHDLTGEYSYTVKGVPKGAPFAVPVTCYGEEQP